MTECNPAPTPEPEGGPAPDTPAGGQAPVPEVGGRGGPEPTRYGDWEVGGICTDF